MTRITWLLLLFLFIGMMGVAQRENIPLRADSLSILHARRVNAPFTPNPSESIPVPERAILWFGEVGPTSTNYSDVRVIYNEEKLFVTLHVFDRLLFYKKNPSPAEIIEWDSATLYLNLDGNTGNSPGIESYQFDGELNWNETREDGAYQAVYRGNGVTWEPAALSFITTDGWQGNGFNNLEEDRGWNLTFEIPFDSLGLTGKPIVGTVWGLALTVHDRDDANGTYIVDQVWPEGISTTEPVTWGQLHFGLPVYDPPPASPGGTVTVRQGVSGTAVPDAHVGGGTTCGGSPPFWPRWGSLNYDGSTYSNIQNQWNLGDWPCFSKYYLTFPLTDLPVNQVVISATLTLYQFGNSNQGGSFDPNNLPEPSLIQVLTVAEDWQEGNITWNNGPLAVENVSRTWVNPLPAGPPYPNVPRHWDISQAVSDAYSRGEPLRLVMYSADNPMHSGKYFRTSDASEEAVRPILQVMWGEDLGFRMAASPSIHKVEPGESVEFTVGVQPTNGSVDSVNIEVGDMYDDISVSPTIQTINPLPGGFSFQVTDLHDIFFSTGKWYTIPITGTGGTAVQTTSVRLLVNGDQLFLPLIRRNP